MWSFSHHTSHHQQPGAKDKGKVSQLWWLGLSTKHESQATAKFVGEQEKTGRAALCISRGVRNGLNPSSPSAACFTQCQGLPTRLSALGQSRLGRSMFSPSASRQPGVQEQMSFASHVPPRGWVGSTLSLQVCAEMHTGSEHVTQQCPLWDSPSPWHAVLHLSHFTKAILHLSEQQKLKPGELGTMQADKPNRPLLLSQGKCSMTVQTSLSKQTSTCWERQISLMFKAASTCSLWHIIPVCFTITKAHWNCSIYHPLSYGNRACISTKERNRAKVKWAWITPEHFTQEGFG